MQPLAASFAFTTKIILVDQRLQRIRARLVVSFPPFLSPRRPKFRTSLPAPTDVLSANNAVARERDTTGCLMMRLHNDVARVGTLQGSNIPPPLSVKFFYQLLLSLYLHAVIVPGFHGSNGSRATKAGIYPLHTWRKLDCYVSLKSQEVSTGFVFLVRTQCLVLLIHSCTRLSSRHSLSSGH